MHRSITPAFLVLALNIFAQFPPIDLEWSALRPYPDIYGPNVHISRDPVHGQYVWAVMGMGLQMDEVANVFLPDGTDVTPSYPYEFNVGSLDHLVDLYLGDSVIYDVIRHESLAGLPYYWHMQAWGGGNPQAPDWDQTIYNPDFPGVLSDFANDLLVTSEATFACGTSETGISPLTSVARVVKTDPNGNVLWNVTWADPASALNTFTSMAVIGDTVFCAAFPYLIILDPADGSLIDAYDMFQSIPVVTGDAQLLANGTRLYWAMQQADLLHYGQFDFAMGQGQIGVEIVPGQLYPARIALDQYDNCWFTTNVSGEGRWYRFDADLNFISAGTLYNSIYHMVLVNGKISITGMLDATTSTTYVITGTPQP